MSSSLVDASGDLTIRRRRMSQEDTFQIVDGPSKFDLMIALFHKPGNFGSQSPNFNDSPLGFKSEDGRWLQVFVRGVQMEDGSHESWIIMGHYAVGGGTFKAYFSTKNRKGALLIDD